MCLYFLFFFKQKTAYEMRISDWSSDVCSSDLTAELAGRSVLVQHAAGHAASEFRLDRLKRRGRGSLVAGGEGGFDLLHQGANPADAGAVDLGAAGVAADALLGWRRIGHLLSSVFVKSREGARRNRQPALVKVRPLQGNRGCVNRRAPRYFWHFGQKKVDLPPSKIGRAHV